MIYKRKIRVLRKENDKRRDPLVIVYLFGFIPIVLCVLSVSIDIIIFYILIIISSINFFHAFFCKISLCWSSISFPRFMLFLFMFLFLLISLFFSSFPKFFLIFILIWKPISASSYYSDLIMPIWIMAYKYNSIPSSVS